MKGYIRLNRLIKYKSGFDLFLECGIIALMY